VRLKQISKVGFSLNFFSFAIMSATVLGFAETPEADFKNDAFCSKVGGAPVRENDKLDRS
jgi:hypothetical protein